MTIQNISAIIVAAGQGVRLGHKVPKAFVKLGGKPLLLYSLKTLAAYPAFSEIIIVVSIDMIEEAQSIIRKLKLKKNIKVVIGGVERWESVRNGVSATASSAEWVCIHDAARPFVTSEVIAAVIDKAEIYKAVITATHVEDTIRKFKHDQAMGTVDRSKLARVGTPQLFHKKTLLKAFGQIDKMKNTPTDEAMLMEKMGEPVGIAWGDSANFKITTARDLLIAQSLLPKLSLK